MSTQAPPEIWIETDGCGSRHVMIRYDASEQGFRKASFHCHYPYADSNSAIADATDFAIRLGASEPVEFRDSPWPGPKIVPPEMAPKLTRKSEGSEILATSPLWHGASATVFYHATVAGPQSAATVSIERDGQPIFTVNASPAGVSVTNPETPQGLLLDQIRWHVRHEPALRWAIGFACGLHSASEGGVQGRMTYPGARMAAFMGQWL